MEKHHVGCGGGGGGIRCVLLVAEGAAEEDRLLRLRRALFFDADSNG